MKKYFNLPQMAVLICTVLLLSGNTVTAAMIQYTYDNAGRLVRAEYEGGKIMSYRYDANGNPLTRKVLGEIIRGDVNTDSLVNLADVFVTLPILAGLAVPPETISDYMAGKKGVDADRLGLAEILYILQDITELR